MKLFKIFLLFLLSARGLFAAWEIIDARGDKVSINQVPERIACISPSTTELIFAIGAGDNILANSRFCRFPDEATKKIKIGGFLDPDFEKIAYLKPDLFILTDSKNDVLTSKLDVFKISRLSLHSDGLENILKNIAILGEVFQKQENANALITKINAKIEQAKQKAKSLNKKRTIVMFGQMAAGKGSYVSEILELVGADNIMANSTNSWAVPQKEHILATSPEVLIIESKSDEDFENQLKIYKADSIWSKTPAVLNNNIYPINSDLISIPCTHIMGAIDRLVEIMEGSQ
ncbi:MAG: helical backbone metal receptor [Opitutales bacterium]